VGIYFVTQNPADIPDPVLAQLSNRVQHALRAYTPAEQKAIRAAASSMRPNPAFNAAEVIMNLGVGHALVSLLDADGVPGIVQQTATSVPRALWPRLPRTYAPRRHKRHDVQVRRGSGQRSA
jgi:DNA helicase HerA-like ATPase